jgi:hypothetical protein
MVGSVAKPRETVFGDLDKLVLNRMAPWSQTRSNVSSERRRRPQRLSA